MLRSFCSDNQTTWDDYLQFVVFAYNTSVNSVTFETPFFLIHGREPLLPFHLLRKLDSPSSSIHEYADSMLTQLKEAHTFIQHNIELAQAKQTANYNSSHSPVNYTIGQHVWIYTPFHKKGLSPKLTQTWTGPYVITHQITPVTFKVKTLSHSFLADSVHVLRLCPYTDPDAPLPSLIKFHDIESSLLSTPVDDTPSQIDNFDSEGYVMKEIISESNSEIKDDKTQDFIPQDTELDMTKHHAVHLISKEMKPVHSLIDHATLKKKNRKSVLQYLVKWKDEKLESSWVNHTFITKDLIKEFRNSNLNLT